MPRTFEELIGDELDGLYQGALFLSGGQVRSAEALVVEAVRVAFEEHRYGADGASMGRGLETHLVRSFLAHVSVPRGGAPEATVSHQSLDPTIFEHLEPEDLLRAASTIPAWPRAALWLVLLRRWSYRDASAAMGVDVESLRNLLSHRDFLLLELASRVGRRGSRGVGS